MNKQEYVEYLNEQLKEASKIAEEIATGFKIEQGTDNWSKKAPFDTAISIIQSGLNYLSDRDLEESKGVFSNYKEQLNVIEAYSLENELEVIKNTHYPDDSNVFGFWAFGVQLIRAILAVQYTEMGVEVTCQYHDDDCEDQYVFNLENATDQDIQVAAFDFIGFTCPLTNAKYKFFSFEDRNEVELIKEVA